MKNIDIRITFSMSYFFIASCSGVKQNKSKVIISHIPAEAVDVLIEKSQIASSSTYS
jgi:hypothetical protein